MVFLFSLTLFASAFLLFSVQPMVGKMLLPVLGGSPSVWNTCMVFFQATLLFAYSYSHALSSAPNRWQFVVHLSLIALPFIVLPIGIGEKAIASIPRESNPIPWLLGFLFFSTALPLFAVSTTAPLLQRWFSTTRHRDARDPYFLYAASNLGSMVGLLMYPFAIEPSLALRQQSSLWAIGYGVLAVLIVSCAVITLRSAHRAREEYAHSSSGGLSREPFKVPTGLVMKRVSDVRCFESAHTPAEPLGFSRMLRWTSFAFIPSSLLLGVTTYITTDIAPFPLLWVIPLALYLLTFILVFAKRPLLPPYWMGRLLSICAVVLMIIFLMKVNHPTWLISLFYLLMFFAAAMIFHGELAKDRPATHHLTAFYLCLSVGGVLGGFFNAIVAPLLFDNVLELPIVMILACALRPAERKSDSNVGGFSFGWRDVAWSVGVGILTLALFFMVESVRMPRPWLGNLILFAMPALLTYRFVRKPPRFALCLAGIFVVGLLLLSTKEKMLMTERNFFGVLRVAEDSNRARRLLFHGTTLHGLQSTDPAKRGEALSYYYRTGPVGELFESLEHNSATAQSIGVVGLGTGSLAAYARPNQDWTFYEIDPDVIRFASDPSLFTYISESQARSLHIIPGDARLRLKEAKSGRYDVLVLDAFSSDAIPMHLVTREAVQLYLEKVSDDGILAFHISNRRLDLEPVFANLALDARLVARIRHDGDISADEEKQGKTPSIWVVMARSREKVDSLLRNDRWQPLRGDPRVGIWTDDFSNVLRVIKWK